jgi:hypothetical protein
VLAVTLLLAVRFPAQNPAAYVPVLIAAAAGLGGAWLGGRAALRAAQTQSQTEHRAWTRDQRKQAYATFLDARDRYVDSWIRWDEAWRSASEPRMKLYDLEHGQDQPKVEDLDLARQDAHRARQEEAAERAKYADRESAFRKALVEVELFGSKPVRDAARAWAKDIDDRYEWLFRIGDYDPKDIYDTQESELRQHRDPFIELIRVELGVGD